jgi:hypothetical protein
MNLDQYIGYLTRRRSETERSRAALDHCRMWRNSGLGLVDMTASWRAELDRRIAELSAIIGALEARVSIGGV